jgi:hypothetical protein
MENYIIITPQEFKIVEKTFLWDYQGTRIMMAQRTRVGEGIINYKN